MKAADKDSDIVPKLFRLPHQVSIYLKICKYLPFEVTNKRIKGWEHIRSLPNGGFVETRAQETITPGDIFVLIAAIKVFQDNASEMVNFKMDMAEMCSVTVKLSVFQQKYIKSGHIDKLIDTLKRLYSYHLIWNDANGKTFGQRYLHDFKIDTGRINITFTISKKFYALCEENGWLIDFTKLQNVSSPTARALYLYLSANSGTIFKQHTFENLLNMTTGTSANTRDNRKQIRRAIDLLVKVGVYSGYDFNGNTIVLHRSHKNSHSSNKPNTLTSKNKRNYLN